MQEIEKIIAIGAIGGSGSRVVARCLAAANIFMGADLNTSEDNLTYTLLFKRQESLKFEDSTFSELSSLFKASAIGGLNSMTDAQKKLLTDCCESQRNGEFTPEWITQRKSALEELATKSYIQRSVWGWKEPNTHMLLERWLSLWPNLYYIHVTRHGLDMAFSSNQRQASIWGEATLGKPYEATKKYYLSYWCAVHKKIKSIQDKYPNRVFDMRFDHLCDNPKEVLENMFLFLKIPYDQDLLEEIKKLITPPKTRGRYHSHSLKSFNTEDIEYIKSIGFNIDQQPTKTSI